MTKKDQSKKNKGFTLVELIVVLVILAILAAILIPALLGYIDRAKMNEDILEGRDVVTAAQSELTKLYGKINRVMVDETVFPVKVDNRKPNGNRDVNAAKSDFAKQIIALAEVEKPYILVLGLGSTQVYKEEEDKRHCYTIYTAMYMKNEDSTPVFFYGDEWGYYYPTDKRIKAIEKEKKGDYKDKNYHVATGIYMQYYILADGNGKYNESNIWPILRDKSAYGYQAP